MSDEYLDATLVVNHCSPSPTRGDRVSKRQLPTALTIIKAIAASDGKLRGHQDYLKRSEMLRLCKRYLERRTTAPATPQEETET